MFKQLTGVEYDLGFEAIIFLEGEWDVPSNSDPPEDGGSDAPGEYRGL